MEYIYPILLALGRFGGIVYVLLLCTLCLACAFWLKPAKSEESFFSHPPYPSGAPPVVV